MQEIRIPTWLARGLRIGRKTFEIDVPMSRESLNTIIEVWYLKVYDFLETSGTVVIDAGANVGLFTLRAALWVGKQGKVVAVEVDPSMSELLMQNVQRNGLCNVTVVTKALSDISGEVDIPGFPAKVESTTLDNLVEALGLDHVDGLKMDIEGFELRALRASRKTLTKVRRLVVETHSQEMDHQTKLLLESLGFRIHRLKLGDHVTAFVQSFSRNPKPFLQSELHRLFKWDETGGPVFAMPFQWLLERRRPDILNAASGLNLIVAEADRS
jgi:FkbM family methyltransferase